MSIASLCSAFTFYIFSCGCLVSTVPAADPSNVASASLWREEIENQPQRLTTSYSSRPRSSTRTGTWPKPSARDGARSAAGSVISTQPSTPSMLSRTSLSPAHPPPVLQRTKQPPPVLSPPRKEDDASWMVLPPPSQREISSLNKQINQKRARLSTMGMENRVAGGGWERGRYKEGVLEELDMDSKPPPSRGGNGSTRKKGLQRMGTEMSGRSEEALVRGISAR
ncbi:hypothetical protein BZA77DRAFT_317389 [Pyronema omphalodes]|nr:hypothetical protein BZA77DRAFT_317389 [Pyronema omphalodes]